MPAGICLVRGHHWEESGSRWIPSQQIFAELPSSHPWPALVAGVGTSSFWISYHSSQNSGHRCSAVFQSTSLPTPWSHTSSAYQAEAASKVWLKSWQILLTLLPHPPNLSSHCWKLCEWKEEFISGLWFLGERKWIDEARMRKRRLRPIVYFVNRILNS